MVIISVRDNENNRWKRKTKNKNTKEQSGEASCSESWRAKRFCCAFKLGFLQLICKASLKSNLELALSTIFKKRELYESKNVVVGCRSLKLWDLISFLKCSSILLLKWWQVSPM